LKLISASTKVIFLKRTFLTVLFFAYFCFSSAVWPTEDWDEKNEVILRVYKNTRSNKMIRRKKERMKERNFEGGKER
jgi:hypothetical protein